MQNVSEKEMPSVSEFGAAKLKEGFRYLGKKFNSAEQQIVLKKDLMAVDLEIKKLATSLGMQMIEEIGKGNLKPTIPSDVINLASDLLAKKERLKAGES